MNIKNVLKQIILPLAFGFLFLAGSVSAATVLFPTSGGTGTSTKFTAGSIVFSSSSTTGKYTQDASNLVFDDTNNRLGIGTASPTYPLHVVHPTGGNYSAYFVDSNGNRGVQIGTNSGGNGSIQGYKKSVSANTDLYIQPDGANLVLGSASVPILVGGLTTAGTGVLQFATATTSAGGITMGTGINLYESAAGRLQFDSTATDGNFNVNGSGTSAYIYIKQAGSNRFYMGYDPTNVDIVSTGSRPLRLLSNSTVALSISSTQNAQFSGLGGTASVLRVNGGDTSTAGSIIAWFNQTNTATSGTNIGLQILPIYNQASGSAANTDLLINRTQTAVGSGAQLLIDAQVGSVSKFKVDNTGIVTIASNLVASNGTVQGNNIIIGSSNNNIAWTGTGATINFSTNTILLNATNTQLLGKLSSYNAIATVSNGIPSELATIDSTGLTANVGASTLYVVPSSGVGMYRVSAYLVTTTAASVSSTMPNAQVVYTDSDSNTSVTLDVSPILGAAGLGQSGLLTANTVGTVFSGTVVIYVKASTTIQYQTVNYASTAGGMTYALRMKLEAL